MVNRITESAAFVSVAILTAFGSTSVEAQQVDLSEIPRRFIIDAEPPRASSRVSAPPGVIQQQAGGESLLDVALFLEERLRQAGHDDLGWFYVHPETNQPPGFAVVLKARRVTDEGKEPNFWKELVWFFTGTPPALHRVVALYFTAPPFARSAQRPLADELREWQARGSSSPFEKLRQDPAGAHRLTALVYLFEESPTSGEFIFVEEADASIHVQAADLDALFAPAGEGR